MQEYANGGRSQKDRRNRNELNRNWSVEEYEKKIREECSLLLFVQKLIFGSAYFSYFYVFESIERKFISFSSSFLIIIIL